MKQEVGSLPDFDLIKILESSYHDISIGVSPITQLGLKWKDENDLEELRHVLEKILEYPCSDMADIHRDANRLGIMDLEENEKVVAKISFDNDTGFIHCNCCGFILQNDEIPMATNMKKISNMGISNSLYFQTIISLSLLLTINLFIYATYALVTNIMAANDYDDQKINEVGLLRLGMSSKQLNQTETNETYLLIQCWLGLLTVVIWCIMLVVIKYLEKKEELRVLEQNKAASDFSVVIHGVPTSMTKAEMQKQFDEYYERLGDTSKFGKLDRKFQIQKYNMAVPFYLTMDALQSKSLKEIIKQADELRQKIILWILSRQHSDTFTESKEVRYKIYQRYFKLKKQIDKKYRQAANKLIRQMKAKNKLQPTTSVYISFQSSYSKDLLCHLNVSNSFINTKKKYYCCNHEDLFYIKHRGQEFQVIIRKAPEPEDIIWNNLGQGKPELVCKKCVTYFIAAVMLTGSFGIMFLLSREQNKSSENFFLSFIISISISIINVILQQAMKRLTYFQREFTQTKHQTSLAIKSILAQLVNSIVLPIVVNYYIQQNLYLSNGLAFDVVLLSLTTAFLYPILKVFDFYYYFSRILAWWYKRPTSKLYLSQSQLNQINSYMAFEIGYEYIYLVNLFLFICFFVSLQPIIVFFGLFGYLAMHWSQKYSLLYRCRRPFPGNDLINTAMYQLIYFGPLFFSLGNLTWCNLVPQGFPDLALIPNIISAGLSVLVILLPYKTIFQKIFKDVYPSQLLYSEQKIFLPSEYDRLNPSTSKQAVQSYVQYVKDFRESLKQRTKEELLKIEQIFCQQHQRGKRNVPKILGIMANFSSIQNILSDHGSVKSDDQEEEDENKVLDPLSIFRELHGNKKNKTIKFVQNWAQQAAAQNNKAKQFDNPPSKQNLTYEILQHLLRNKDLKQDQESLREESHQQTIEKLSSPNLNFLSIFGGGRQKTHPENDVQAERISVKKKEKEVQT